MVQNADGGWGESCGSYDDPTLRGIGPSTPSQTAWACLGCWRRATRGRFGGKGGSLAGDAADTMRNVGRIGGRTQARGDLHRDWISAGVLPGLSPVPRLFSAAGVDDVQTGDGEGSGSVRVISNNGRVAKISMEGDTDGSSGFAGVDGCELCAEAEAQGGSSIRWC